MEMEAERTRGHGTRAGGLKAALTNKTKYGDDFYKVIGTEGGKKGRTGGFYANRELARTAGKIGGTVSRRGDTPKLTKSEARKARQRILQEISDMQKSSLSAKHGQQRPW